MGRGEIRERKLIKIEKAETGQGYKDSQAYKETTKGLKNIKEKEKEDKTEK